MNSLRALSGLALAGPTVAALAAEPSSGWWVEGGPSIRLGPKISVSGSSYVQVQGNHGAPSALLDGIAPPGEYADRIYDDGYVKLDSGTLNPDSVGSVGNTWNWAYDSTEQYSAAAGELSFHQSLGPGYLSGVNSAFTGEEDSTSVGVDIQVGKRVWESGGWRLDLAVALQGFWGGSADYSGSSYRESIGTAVVTDVYDVSESVHPDHGFPGPQTEPGGYAGTYDGPAGGASSWVGGFPVIYNLPTRHDVALQETSVAYNTIEISVDSTYYQIAFAPRLSRSLSQTFDAHLQPKIGAGIVNASADRRETFYESTLGGGVQVRQTWQDEESQVAVQLALGIRAGLSANLGRNITAGLFAGYEWDVDPAELEMGPNQVKVDNSGFVAGLTLGIRF